MNQSLLDCLSQNYTEPTTEKIGELSQTYRGLVEVEEYDETPRSHRKSKRSRRTLSKPEALLPWTSNVHDSLLGMKQLQREQAEVDLDESIEPRRRCEEKEEEFLTPTRLVYAFEAGWDSS